MSNLQNLKLESGCIGIFVHIHDMDIRRDKKNKLSKLSDFSPG